MQSVHSVSYTHLAPGAGIAVGMAAGYATGVSLSLIHIYSSSTAAAPDISHSFGKWSCIACGNIVHSFFNLAVKFKAAGQFFVGFNAHNGKVCLLYTSRCV